MYLINFYLFCRKLYDSHRTSNKMERYPCLRPAQHGPPNTANCQLDTANWDTAQTWVKHLPKGWRRRFILLQSPGTRSPPFFCGRDLRFPGAKPAGKTQTENTLFIKPNIAKQAALS